MPTSRMDTNGLLPGDLVLGCEEAQIMVPLGGLYIDRTKQDEKTYGIWAGGVVLHSQSCSTHIGHGS